MKRLSPLWISLLLFSLPVLIGLSLNRLAGNVLAHQLLKEKRLEIEAAMAARQRELQANIGEQLAHFAWDCGEKDMALLRDPELYSHHIRLQGIKLASGRGCSSLGPDLPVVDPSSLPEPMANSVGLTATEPEFGTEQELVVFAKQRGDLAYWVLSNSWSHSILEQPCRDCFYLELIPLVSDISGPELFPRGDRRIKEEPGSRRLAFTAGEGRIQQVLWSGKALQDHALHQARRGTCWIGAALGAMLLAGYWLLRSYRRSLKGLLNAGLARQEFVPFYQAVVGFEALLRWQRDDDVTAPGAFIAYAEQQGLILPMTEQLLDRVIADLPQLAPELWVSVNLVAAHIEHPLLRNQLLRHDWPSPARLTFELTEREPIMDIEAAIQEITALQQKGYHFKLDDFGTGYGGFAYLQRLGIRQIKIDKMFIDTIGTDDPKRNLLDAIIAFGRKSDMEMIAEGVETRAQVDYLALHGVHLIQGYLYAHPMPLPELLPWLQARSAS